MNDKCKIFVLTIIVLFVTTNCNKDDSISQEYVGEWRTDYDIHDDYKIINIDNESKGSYIEYGPTSEENIEGDCKTENNYLYIGDKKLEINETPVSESDTSCVWSSYQMTCIVYSSKMKLDKRVYYKVEKIIE